MRMLVKVTCPPEPFNAAVREGTAARKIGRILEDLKPEATYFFAEGGKRTGLLVLDLAEPSRMPAIAEPWFLQFSAGVEFHPVMSPDDLAKAGLESLGKQYAR